MLLERIEKALVESGVVGRGPNFRTNYGDAILAMAEVEGLGRDGQYSDALASQWLDAQEQLSPEQPTPKPPPSTRLANGRPDGKLHKVAAPAGPQYAQGTAAAARAKLRRAMAEHTGPIRDLGAEHVATVVGLDGNQRWYVTLNGQVFFATKYASSGRAIQKAQQLGFGLK